MVLITHILETILIIAMRPWALGSASIGFCSGVTNLLIYPLYKEVTTENLLLSKYAPDR